uniref:Uncharacterized protein n=1 Tax=Chromera velia CCMP2878 TaxID=1169474 RepID=A0A0G4GQ32_9ALVE|eukprot:Cvel_5040.t1-p1 / transcript=Cvel_5040.t1 / gene=Cvel_5040 / organism=Chromera_velia_CCMP2878 / gene_product=hypothetical protein / transcript_product=hypothetical protein / location=Cvel_scaffold229:87157-87579(+) / protein_length=141 / sequence_SO=supercontig / SO=protein_coding / is_pseudo=false
MLRNTWKVRARLLPEEDGIKYRGKEPSLSDLRVYRNVYKRAAWLSRYNVINIPIMLSLIWGTYITLPIWWMRSNENVDLFPLSAAFVSLSGLYCVFSTLHTTVTMMAFSNLRLLSWGLCVLVQVCLLWMLLSGPYQQVDWP